jgi:release factor glutamine methyltransferase
MPTVGELLSASALPRAETRALLATVLELSRERLVAFPETAVPGPALEAFAALVARRQAGEPLAYLRGMQEFYGRPFCVTPAVLVPRPDTETLVEVALELLQSMPAPSVLELGTGSGCIATTLQLERPDARILATDVSEAALAVARGNARALGAAPEFLLSHWYAALAPQARFDLIVSNPPYVAAGDPHLDGLRYEPHHALTDGSDGLQSLSHIIAGAAGHLKPGAWVVLEHGYDQAAAVERLLRAAGFRETAARRDAGGHLRVTCGRA